MGWRVTDGSENGRIRFEGALALVILPRGSWISQDVGSSIGVAHMGAPWCWWPFVPDSFVSSLAHTTYHTNPNAHGCLPYLLSSESQGWDASPQRPGGRIWALAQKLFRGGTTRGQNGRANHALATIGIYT